MKALHLVPVALVASVAIVAGCSGGGSTSGAPVAPVLGPTVLGNATFPLSVTVPAKPVTASKARAPQSARSPKYISVDTAAFAVYDGTTVIYVGNFNGSSLSTVYAKTGPTSVTAGACTNVDTGATCTVTVTTTVGSHTFDVISYPNHLGAETSNARVPQDIGTVPAFEGVILSEGELAVTLNPGTNPGQTITLLGVADKTEFNDPNFTLQLNGTGPLVGIIGTSYTIQYFIVDSEEDQIVQPGNYDNGPVTITATSPASPGPVVSMSPISQNAPPATTGAQTINFTCTNNGTATLTASAKNKPNTTYASGLTYSTSNYSSGALGTTTLQCVPNSATMPITVDSVKRTR
jgi:hypothetical protein